MDIFEIEKLAIVIVALIMAYAEYKQGVYNKRPLVKFGLAFMGLYWASYYTYSIIRVYYGWSFPDHQIFVRSGLLFTLSLVASSAWITLNELKGLKK